VADGPGTLYVVATPIGNLGDVTLRALEVLRSAQVVACEDTRRTRKLLAHHGVSAHLLSYHEHNEEARLPGILARLREGASVALVTDAGTPGISDPGHRLVRAAREAGVPVAAVPGPSALTAALSVCGLPTDRFLFAGFLPPRAGARRKALDALRREPRTLVLFEAPHRLPAALLDLEEVLGGERRAVLARELTKLHEEHLAGTLAELRRSVEGRPEVRGEATLVVEGAPAEAPPEHSAASLTEAIAEVERLVRERGLGRKEALHQVSRHLGVPRNDLYRALLDRRGE